VDLAQLGQLDGLFAGGQIALERRQRVLGRGHVREDGRPVVDLGLLDGDGGLELLVGAHDRVRRHLAEVAGEHRVAAALLDLLVARLLGLGRGQRVAVVLGDLGVGRGHLDLELFLDRLEFDHGVARAAANRGDLALEVVLDHPLTLALDLGHGRRLGSSVLGRYGSVVLGFAHGGFLAVGRLCSFRSLGADGRLRRGRSRLVSTALLAGSLLARRRLRHLRLYVERCVRSFSDL